MPGWLVTKRETIGQEDLLKVFEPTRELMSPEMRVAVSAMVGAAATVGQYGMDFAL